MVKVKLARPRYGQRSAKLASGIGHHKIHSLRRNLLGCNDKVALVFAVFIIDYYYEFTVAEVGYRLFYAVEFYIFIHRRYLLSVGYIVIFNLFLAL